MKKNLLNDVKLRFCLLFLLLACKDEALDRRPLTFDGNVELRTQQQVIDFGKKNYEVVNGRLVIGGYCGGPPDHNCYSSDVHDLTALKTLRKITSTLKIELTELQNLNGLNSITELGALFVRFNGKLIDFEGLNSLKIVNQNVAISQQSVQSLNGLQNLFRIYGTLAIEYSRGHSDLQGLNALAKVGELSISFNSELTSLDGLENLKEIDSELVIKYNKALTNYCTLVPLLNSNLVTGPISISENTLFNPTVDDIMNGKCSK